MEAADTRQGNDLTGARRLDRARDGCVTVERHVWPVLVVVGSMVAYQAKQVAFAEDDHVVE